jgi:hypothetical protein
MGFCSRFWYVVVYIDDAYVDGVIMVDVEDGGAVVCHQVVDVVGDNGADLSFGVY